MDFVAPHQLGAGSIQACLQPGDPESDVAFVNLRALDWTEPAGLVAIATFVESQWQIGRTPQLIGPADTRRGRYLSRMHLGTLIEDFDGIHDLPSINEWSREGYLLELQRFDGKDAPPALATLVEERLRGTRSAEAIHKGICEIGANVPDHSGREHGYIAAITTHGGTRVSFAIGDAGVGLVEPLAGRGYERAGDVMRDLFEAGGLSRIDEAGRGRGVYRTKEVVTREGGTIHMASGRDAVRVNQFGLYPASSRIPMPGTILQGAMPC
ncbi:hypothetical protein [Nocardioides sp. cx-173]|uniref:hypothetical protein n=1 Tax=Nocardioides sp. cx-173 TaxID=2898796 RepID=UPI001E5381D5|nr:hypothetical protein [Nocardioides sp. cx-173]MCD4525245.1 hypothetical protein [Nocardioides sp. cx-173]UGB40952.1 hypothetical protein LQ940_16440 [Nocardioides sp. cx-173]